MSIVFAKLKSSVIRCLIMQYSSIFKASLLILIINLTYINVNAQINLLPSIGIDFLPADNDSVCDIPLRLDYDFDNAGFVVSDAVPDLNLFDLNGDSLNLKTALETGKPVLLITCSFTCPVFRDQLPQINALQTQFGNDVLIYLIYTVEAHPNVDISPYYGFVNTTERNIEANILYEQPKTYGDRKQIVADMLDSLVVKVPVLIDGPCNNFWVNFECGPNTAYLLRTDGVIFSKHGWFNQDPHDMTNDINKLLGIDTGNTGNTYTGNFKFELSDDSVQYVQPGAITYIHGNLTNLSKTDGVSIQIVKHNAILSEGWSTSICTDVCYSPMQDSVNYFIDANSTSPVSIDFYTGDIPDSGSILIRFTNSTLSTESFSQNFKVYTTPPPETVSTSLNFYPNPTNGYLKVVLANADLEKDELQLFDESGRIFFSQRITSPDFILDLSKYTAGIYFMRVGSVTEKIVKF